MMTNSPVDLQDVLSSLLSNNEKSIASQFTRVTMRKEDLLNHHDKYKSKYLWRAPACGSKPLKGKTAGMSVKKTKVIFSRNTNSRRNLILQKRFMKKSPCKDCQGDHTDSMITKNLKLKRMKRRKLKMKNENKDLDEPLRLQRRVKYLLVRLKLEQNLIDAYCAEGWNGQSREKIKPEKELQRAKKQILKCKLGIRDAIHQLDLISSEGRIDDSLVAPDGSVHHEHIFCTKCKSREASLDNDIILCDGTCNCAFHQKCLDPPLATEDIPPENEAWLCIYCEHKMEIMEAMNAHLGTQFSVNNTWKDIFKDEAASPDFGSMFVNPEEEWPDDDSEDTDYEPDGGINGCGDSEDDMVISEGSFSSVSCSPENDDYTHSGWHTSDNKLYNNDYPEDVACGTDSYCPPDYVDVSGPRRRYAVDYKQLYDCMVRILRPWASNEAVVSRLPLKFILEGFARKLVREMFGKDTANIETDDEDWGPPRKRRRRKERDAASTLMSLCESEKKLSDFQSMERERGLPSNLRNRRPCSRIPIHAVEKLRQVFTEDELPNRAIKQNLSDQLGLDFEKVNKWFKNARYEALKSRKPETAVNKAGNSLGSDCSFASSVGYLKDLKRVRWRKDLISSNTPLKKQKDWKASVGSPIKAECKRRIISSETRRQVEAAEWQMERLYQAETKLQMLKFILLTLSTREADKLNELCYSQQHAVYVPTSELKEKAVEPYC